ncbi:MAG: lysophospholipase [Candidatus Hydrogenedentes bacterium]|nr:lysophospholipase [Candidatus Hydrogenedentota bacterium]
METIANSGYFKTFDGVGLFERRWESDGEAKAHLALLHGYGEHCGRYEHVARPMNAAGITVHTYDQRGFGRSPGRRAYIRDYKDLLRDLDAFLAHIKPRIGDKPLFMMGHSMGGQLLVLYYVTRRPAVRGLVCSSAFLQFAGDVPKLLVALSGVVGAVLPWLPVGGVNTEALSRDPAVVQAADADPLSYHGRVRARTGAQLKFAIDRIAADMHTVDAPLYILHGTDDKLVPVAGSRLLHERAESADKTLRIYEGGYHELWNDLCKEDAIGGIVSWITARLP